MEHFNMDKEQDMSTLRRIHRLSAFLLISFVIVHLCNHLFALWGAEQHIAVMEALRTLYRHPLVEPLLLLAVLSQIVTGLRLFWKLRKARGNRLVKLQRLSGLFLAFFMLSHVLAALYSRFVSHLDTNFYWAASVLVIRPYVYYYAPYYALGVTAFGAHAALGLRLILAKKRISVSPAIIYSVVATTLVLGIVLVMTIGGVFYPVALPPAYVLP
jgi:succinate dehydrogenase/fumarate reductase cytochrome b subunit